ncbi:MAG: YggT family protein [Actinobacteria bacterium]|nr:YggT family protein [Actinomycetota bacterium]
MRRRGHRAPPHRLRERTGLCDRGLHRPGRCRGVRAAAPRNAHRQNRIAVEILCNVVDLFVILVFVRVVLSWFPVDPRGPVGQVSRLVSTVTDPVMEPVRRVLPSVGPIDISPIVVVLFLTIVVQGLILGC